MSWYLFKDAAAYQNRGKKVEGFNYMPRPKINLSWGMNEAFDGRPQSNSTNSNQHNLIPDTVPATMTQKQSEPTHNVKILTETSEEQQEQLLKLIKSQKAKDLQHDVIEMFNKRNKDNSPQSGRSFSNPSNAREQKNSKSTEFDKRIRYLENSLLPSCRRDSMATIFDYDLNKGVPLEESRVSGKSVLHNKKNQSTVPMGDGFNYFIQPEQKNKQLYDRLKEQYEYEEVCKRRIDRSNVRLG